MISKESKSPYPIDQGRYFDRLARAALDKFLTFKSGTYANIARHDIPEDMELGASTPRDPVSRTRVFSGRS